MIRARPFDFDNLILRKNRAYSRNFLIIHAFSRPKYGTIYTCLVFTKLLSLKKQSKEATLRIYVTSIVYFIFWNLKWNDLDNHPSCLLLLNLLVYLRLPTWLAPVLSFSFLFFFLKANGERRLHLRLYGYIRWRIHSSRYLEIVE